MAQVPGALAPMSERFVRPDWVRRLNLMAGSVGGRARDLVPVDADDLLHRAEASLGGIPSGDLGDPHWQDRFESLVAAVDDSHMHVVGRLMTKQELLRSLRTRLLLTAAAGAAPEITAEAVAALVRELTVDRPPIAQGEPRSWISLVPNEFPTPGRPDDVGLSALDAAYAMAPFVVGPDEALVIRSRCPKCRCGGLP